MIQASPFVLALLTGAADEPSQDETERCEEIYRQFTERRDLLVDTNGRLAKNRNLPGCGLRIPLTDSLFEQLCNTPPWSNMPPNSPNYRLKTIVLAFLGNRHRASGSVIYLNSIAVEHIYQLISAPAFFPGSLTRDLCDAWVEATGICAFDRSTAKSAVSPLPIHAVWIVSTEQRRNDQVLTIGRRHILDEDSISQSCTVPILAVSDPWAWELLVRKSLWQDPRLPFNGPDGAFGYCPPQGWQPGERPITVRIEGQRGFKDALGGLWQWEGGRAQISSPLGGHWNVQLLNAAAKQSWLERLQEVYARPVRLRTSHLNIEVDGRIVDRTFELR